jgi:ABC-2 type transport system permease protein
MQQPLENAVKGAWATVWTACAAKLNGGLPVLCSGYLLKIVYLLPLVFLWRAVAADGVNLGGFTLGQIVTYTCVSTMIGPQLNVWTAASAWNYDGHLADLYRRPRTIFGQIITRTVGGWLPELMLFSLPMALLLPLLGVRMMPATAWFFPCLALSVSLGFAADALFVCAVIRMRHTAWVATRIRSAVTVLLSGAVIPFDLLPWGVGEAFKLLPFGSMAAAPLAVLVGRVPPASVLPLQIGWNLALWPAAAVAFRKSRERMVSYGG